MLWQGRANTLSPKHGVKWLVIDSVAQATLCKCAYKGGLLRLSLGGCVVRNIHPSGPAHRVDGNSWPPQRISDGWIDGDLARSILLHAPSTDSNTRAASYVLGCDSLATEHPPPAFRSPSRRLGTWPLHGCPRSGQGRYPQATDAFRILLATRARQDSPFTSSRKETVECWRPLSPVARTSSAMAP